MNLIELEEGLSNLIAMQPTVLMGEKAKTVSGIKNLIEASKLLSFRIEEYSADDELKEKVSKEAEKFEQTLVDSSCEALQEVGINIMLYVPKYAMAYTRPISKYVDNIFEEEKPEAKSQKSSVKNTAEKTSEKYMVVKKEQKQTRQEQKSAAKETPNTSKKSENAAGRDYLMNLLKK